MRRIGWMMLGLALSAGCSAGNTNLVMTEDNNYTQESTLTLGHYAVQEQADTTIDWSALTLDLRGRPLDPTTVDQLYFSLLDMTEDALVDRVLANDIPQSEAISSTWGNESQISSATITDFNLLGNPFDLSELLADPAKTWVVTLVEVPEGTSEQQVLMTVVVDPGANPGTVDITNGTSVVSVTPDLHTPPPIVVTGGADSYTMDWSGMTVDVFGNDFDTLIANTLWIVHYPGSVSDVEADFLLADYNADAVYKLDVRGKDNALLTEATDADCNAFAGFTADGTWLVGLVDKGSLSPLPLVMAVVSVE